MNPYLKTTRAVLLGGPLDGLAVTILADADEVTPSRASLVEWGLAGLITPVRYVRNKEGRYVFKPRELVAHK